MAKPTIEVHSLTQLEEIIAQEIAENSVSCDLNHLDVSEMQDLSDAFKGSLFQGNVSSWKVDMVFDMRGLFADSSFAGDLSNWDINPYIHVKGMLPKDFKGILPTFLKLPVKQRTLIYKDMFNDDAGFSKYLEKIPFGEMHVVFLANTNVSPVWLAQEQLAHVRHARNLGLGLGCTPDELFTLLQEKLLAPKTGAAMESFEMDFSQ